MADILRNSEEKKIPLSKEVIALSKLPWFPQVMRELGYEHVVLCKDCENYVANDRYVMCGLSHEYTDKDWFCGNGRKRKARNETESVKHGRWLDVLVADDEGETDGVECSECGYTDINVYWAKTYHRFCPNCGAKMDDESMDNVVVNNSNATTVANDGNAMSTETKERNHMQRLIDAEKLGLTDFEIVMCDGDYKEALKMLIEKIENAPTVDAEPKQAYVIVDEDGNMECSNCGSSFCFDDYCAHCGAKLIKE